MACPVHYNRNIAAGSSCGTVCSFALLTCAQAAKHLFPALKSFCVQDAFQLVRWILSTNRSYLAPLEGEERIEAMQTPHQFRLMLSSASHAAKYVVPPFLPGCVCRVPGQHIRDTPGFSGPFFLKS